MNAEQFRTYILAPILLDMENLCGIKESQYAEDLLMATAAQETHLGEYVHQEGGPAIGIYQMEPATIQGLFNDYIYPKKVYYTNILGRYTSRGYDDLSQLHWNWGYATVLARLNYFRVPEALPAESNRDTLWYYYKKYWNTSLGAATQDQFNQSLDKYSDIH